MENEECACLEVEHQREMENLKGDVVRLTSLLKPCEQISGSSGYSNWSNLSSNSYNSLSISWFGLYWDIFEKAVQRFPIHPTYMSHKATSYGRCG